ncbi:phosphoesterase [Bacteroides uniformis]|uniref:metallophosphoesterase family protein n=1 Tax=Bacteroides uniformis TaxID=820 RepID=UPI00233EA743|nr:phosphoesterase [Bacteroides uniformis]MDC1812113.1 phosphoesterase [Bacteroides uniformis]
MSKVHPVILMLNDIHISKDNIPDFSANWNEALTVCNELSITDIAFGGDLFLSRSAQTLDVLLAVHDALLTAGKRGINVTLINGNHDKVNQEAIRGYCHIFDQHDNVFVVDDYYTLILSDEWKFVLHLIPYFPENGSFIDKLTALVENGLDKERANFLYIHEGINGALSQSSDKELAPNIFNDFDKVFVGHYHNRCSVSSQIEYIGSSRQNNFGEDEAKGYTVIYTDGSTAFIQNQTNIRYKVMDVPVEKVNINLADELEEIKADGRYRVKVRVHSTSTQTTGIDKESLLNAGANKVEIITEDVEASDIQATSLTDKLDGRKIKDNYQQFCHEKGINYVLGLSYLDKIE